MSIVKVVRRLFSSASKEMIKHSVVHDVIDKEPAEVASVQFPSGAKAEMGNILTPTQVKDQPTVEWLTESEGDFYTVCMTDPDAPSREKPKFREWHHWLVGNIPGTNVSQGTVLSEYIGAGPPKNTGLHRYVILVYKQNGKIQFNETHLTNKSGEKRGGFSIRKFASKYKLGAPIAGNFFQAEHDDYVPKLYKQLGV